MPGAPFARNDEAPVRSGEEPPQGPTPAVEVPKPPATAKPPSRGKVPGIRGRPGQMPGRGPNPAASPVTPKPQGAAQTDLVPPGVPPPTDQRPGARGPACSRHRRVAFPSQPAPETERLLDYHRIPWRGYVKK